MIETVNRAKVLDLLAMGTRIRQRRELLGISREGIAGYLGVSSKFIADVENGARGVSIKNLYLLKQVLQTSADYILAGLEEEPEKEAERERIEDGIIEYLQSCNIEELKCLKQIARFYVEGLNQR